MPGIDFTLLRQQLSLTQVLDLVGFTATTRRGPQVRGPCPVHGSASGSRSFAAHLDKSFWHCFRCGAGGNALDLYLAVTKLPVYEGARELCARLGVEIPRRATRMARPESAKGVRHAPSHGSQCTPFEDSGRATRAPP
jgi:DNA primase